MDAPGAVSRRRRPGLNSIVRNAKALARGDLGQGIMEYALIVAVIAIACFATMVLLGHGVANTYGLQNKASLWNE
jgi:Flp pilus assembly pilin Flp